MNKNELISEIYEFEKELAQKIDTDIRVTRIAQGISFGSDIEYVDEVTLSRAISGRIEL